jgi:hypothetical protein
MKATKRMTMEDDDWGPKFLAVLAQGHTIGMAAGAAGVNRSTVYRRRKTDKAFAEDWDAAVEDGTDAVEELALRRAKEGYSDQLVMFILKARRPEKYLERQRLEHVRVDFRDAVEELELMAKRIQQEDEHENERKELPPPCK